MKIVENTKIKRIKSGSLTEKVDSRCVSKRLGRREADSHVHWDEVRGARIHHKLHGDIRLYTLSSGTLTPNFIAGNYDVSRMATSCKGVCTPTCKRICTCIQYMSRAVHCTRPVSSLIRVL